MSRLQTEKMCRLPLFALFLMFGLALQQAAAGLPIRIPLPPRFPSFSQFQQSMQQQLHIQTPPSGRPKPMHNTGTSLRALVPAENNNVIVNNAGLLLPSSILQQSRPLASSISSSKLVLQNDPPPLPAPASSTNNRTPPELLAVNMCQFIFPKTTDHLKGRDACAQYASVVSLESDFWLNNCIQACVMHESLLLALLPYILIYSYNILQVIVPLVLSFKATNAEENVCSENALSFRRTEALFAASKESSMCSYTPVQSQKKSLAMTWLHVHVVWHSVLTLHV